MSDSAPFSVMRAQLLLEINEDIISAMLENMQLGRLNDCMKFYSLLHGNLISMASELDNYPCALTEAYAKVFNFPDEIMKKDPIDTVRPAEEVAKKPLSKAPLPPPCQKCAMQKLSSVKCRVEYLHVDPSFRLSVSEREEFVRATQVLEAKYREYNKQELLRQQQHSVHDSINNIMITPGNLPVNNNYKRRNYRRWTNAERHTVLLGIFIYGKRDFASISSMLDDRSDMQVKSYIAKSVSNELLIQVSKGDLPPAPPEFHATSRLTKLFTEKIPFTQQNNSKDSMAAAVLSVLNLMPHEIDAPTLSNTVSGENLLLSHKISQNLGEFVYPAHIVNDDAPGSLVNPANVDPFLLTPMNTGLPSGDEVTEPVGKSSWDTLMKIAASYSNPKATFYYNSGTGDSRGVSESMARTIVTPVSEDHLLHQQLPLLVEVVGKNSEVEPRRVEPFAPIQPPKVHAAVLEPSTQASNARCAAPHLTPDEIKMIESFRRRADELSTMRRAGFPPAVTPLVPSGVIGGVNAVNSAQFSSGNSMFIPEYPDPTEVRPVSNRISSVIGPPRPVIPEYASRSLRPGNEYAVPVDYCENSLLVPGMHHPASYYTLHNTERNVVIDNQVLMDDNSLWAMNNTDAHVHFSALQKKTKTSNSEKPRKKSSTPRARSDTVIQAVPRQKLAVPSVNEEKNVAGTSLYGSVLKGKQGKMGNSGKPKETQGKSKSTSKFTSSSDLDSQYCGTFDFSNMCATSPEYLGIGSDSHMTSSMVQDVPFRLTEELSFMGPEGPRE